MRKGSRQNIIRIRGARQNNLKGFDLDLPTRSLIVITGLSGSGKSSLAFDTLYAEGQRRYIETFSPYARQFFDRMDKPRVDAIEGIPPAIALEQRNAVRTTRSTVGTMTEICDHLKLLWPSLARLHCRRCGQPVTKETPRDIWERIVARSAPPNASPDSDSRTPEASPAAGPPSGPIEALVTFNVPLSAKLALDEQLALVARQGFQRLWMDGDVLRLDESLARLGAHSPAPSPLVVVQDRVKMIPANRARFVEACEQAYHFGHGALTIFLPGKPHGDGRPRWMEPIAFSQRLHCAECDLEYAEPVPARFSFNHPLGACPECKGFGRIIAIDYDLAIPDRGKSLAQGAVRPWQTEMGAESQADLVRASRAEGIPLDVPFRELSPTQQRWVIEGAPDYGEGNEWPKAWYGVRGYFRWLESKAYKMHVRVLLSRYRAYTTCPACQGRRLQPEALLWRLPVEPASQPPAFAGVHTAGMSLADFYALPLRDALRIVDALASRQRGGTRDPIAFALAEVHARLRFLDEVGVGYLTLDRPTRTLSGGETQRVNLTTCLGTRLVNTLFVLDEPSVGLHARDTERLVRVLTRLRDLGNTVVVVEHEAALMRAADQIVDLGPGHGESGGNLVVHGPLNAVLRHPRSLTGAYLAGRRKIPLPDRRPVPRNGVAARRRPGGDVAFSVSPDALAEQSVPYRGGADTILSAPDSPCLTLRGVTRHNLRNVEVTLPLARLVCLSGVSGSGKTTLASELLRLLRQHLDSSGAPGPIGVPKADPDPDPPESESAEDASPPTSATLDGAAHLGAVLLVDQSPIGRTPRSNPAVYTGAFEPIRELFADTDAAQQRGLSSSAFSFNSAQGQCEQCRGAGFEKIEMQFLSDVFIRCPACEGRRYRPHILEVTLDREGAPALSIADVLELTVDDVMLLLASLPAAAAARARARLGVVQEVGLGYLRLGQPINTLSGGESQRLKLAGHLAESEAVSPTFQGPPATNAGLPGRSTLFVFDEPTTGLHFEDVKVLLQVFQRLVDVGHSVLIIEHNLDVLKCADWLIDLGPEGGDAGGRVVVAGPPEAVAQCPESHTGAALRGMLGGPSK